MSLEIGPRTGDPMPGTGGGGRGGQAEDLTPALQRWGTEPGAGVEGAGKTLPPRKPDSA